MDENWGRPITRRRLLKGAALAGIAGGTGAFLAACAASQTPSPSTALGSPRSGVPATIKPTRTALRIWGYPATFGPALKLSETAIAEYEATYPGKTVELGEFTAEFGAQLAAGRLTGDLPDIFTASTERGTAYFYDLMYPLNDLFTSVGIPDDDWTDLARSHWEFDGQFYGAPAITGTKCYIYRKDLFDEAGVTTFPSTWEEFVDASIKLTKRDASGNIIQAGFHMDRVADNEQIIQHALQNGGSQFDPSDAITGKAAITDPAFLEAFTWMLDLKRVHQIVPMTGTFLQAGEWASISGKAAMELQGPWWAPAIVASNPDDADLLGVGLPLERGTRAGIGDAGGALCVYKDSEVLEDALNFMEIFLKEDNYIAYHDSLDTDSPFAALTGRKSINDKLQWVQNDPIVKDSAFVEALNFGAEIGWKHVGAQEMQTNLWGPAMERALNATAPDEQILTELAAAMDSITDRHVRIKG